MEKVAKKWQELRRRTLGITKRERKLNLLAILLFSLAVLNLYLKSLGA